MTSAESSHKPPGLLLALAGCEERLQLALGQHTPSGYRLLASREWTVPGESVRFLVPGLKETLDAFAYTVKDIDRIACVRGPGSFTGLRLVLAAAQGLAAGSGAAVAGIDYLRLLASGPASIANGILHVLTYARRGLVYFQSFNLPSMKEAYPLTSFTVEQAAHQMGVMSDTAFVMGSGLRKNPEFFQAVAREKTGYALLPTIWDAPSPHLLLEAALGADFSNDAIEPIYVRPSDAEDNLPTIAKKRGLDPDKAQKRLQELQQR